LLTAMTVSIRALRRAIVSLNWLVFRLLRMIVVVCAGF
jgi:hypothetical protein